MKFETNEYNGKTYHSVMISRVDSKGKILDFKDLVQYGDSSKIKEKVSLTATEYGKDKKSVCVKAFMDLDDFMVLCHDVINKKAITFDDFKGSADSNYKSGFEARVLKVKDFPDYGEGKGAYTITITNGEGSRGDLGQVSALKGAETKSVTIHIAIADARRAFLYAYNYLISKQTAWIARNYTTLYPVFTPSEKDNEKE